MSEKINFTSRYITQTEPLRGQADLGFGPGMSHRLLDEIDCLNHVVNVAAACSSGPDPNPDRYAVGYKLMRQHLAEAMDWYRENHRD